MGTRNANKHFLSYSKDHPHACGDKRPSSKNEQFEAGSSPRVWGQATKSALFAKGDRIIPTRVGTSATVAKQYDDFLDHPHACGDKSEVAPSERKQAGSSPRVWGQAFIAVSGTPSEGIIPTRVGTRTATQGNFAGAWDHPHACGDKRGFLLDWESSLRIIPTRVGTSKSFACRAVVKKDHPHACGDKSSKMVNSSKILGSSPRVWGQELALKDTSKK